MNFMVRNECEKHNRKYRDVERRGYYSLGSFFEESNGDLLITGGSQPERSNVICSLIKRQEVRGETVIVFSNSQYTLSSLLAMAEKGDLDHVIVSSKDFRNYDPFTGMSREQCIDFFASAAMAKGNSNANSVRDFSGAFLSIAEGIGRGRNLSSMLALSDEDDNELAYKAQKQNDTRSHRILSAAQDGGADFRTICDMTLSALSGITVRETNSGFSISTAINEPCVLYINTITVDAELMAVYFAHELGGLLAHRFTVIFDDCILTKSKKLREVIAYMQQIPDITVAVSSRCSVLPPIAAGQEEISTLGFDRQIVFLTDCPTNDTDRVLSSFGSYTHYAETIGVGTPPRVLFSFARSQQSGITTYSRPRVMLAEEVNRIILRGNCGNTIMSVERLE